MKARIGVILAAVLVLAATLIIAAGNDLSETPLAAALASWCAGLLLAAAAIAVVPRRWWIVPAAISALYALACVSLALFQLGAPLGLDADFIRRANGVTGVHAAAGEPHRHCLRIMIPTIRRSAAHAVVR